jgi:hypothetical protein
MVSKLLLAVQETYLQAIQNNNNETTASRLLDHYYEISEGIGVHKSPSQYGAFPTDPYSHTPSGRGAQQPGMTGQVKEDILCRFGELGVFIKNGCLQFNPCMLRKSELLGESGSFLWFDIDGAEKVMRLEAGSLCFTYCQIPIIYELSDQIGITIINRSDVTIKLDSRTLDQKISQQIFQRTGEILQLIVHLDPSELK